MAKMRCGACGRLTDPGRCCEKCGADLTPSGDGGAPSPAPLSPLVQPAIPVMDEPRLSHVPAAASRTVYLNHDPEFRRPAPDKEPQLEEQPSCNAFTSDGYDDCPWVSVEMDSLMYCISGMPGVLRLRLTCLGEGVEDLHVYLRIKAAVNPSGVEQWAHPKINKKRDCALPIPLLAPGPYSAQVVLSLTKDQTRWTYDSNLELYVYPADVAENKIAEQMVFTINNDIHTGHAADVHVSQNIADELGRIARESKKDARTDLLRLMQSGKLAYRRLQLDELSREEKPVQKAPQHEAVTSRLTLEVKGQRIHLIADRRVTFGRNRSNAIITRIFDTMGRLNVPASERISKFHCLWTLEGSDCVIHDGAPNEVGQMKASSLGVFWQGKPVQSQLRIPLDTLFAPGQLGLAKNTGGTCELMFSAHSQRFTHGDCHACTRTAAQLCQKGRLPAILLRRSDALPECYLLLWSCCDLGTVMPSLQGLVVCHEQGAFSWRRGEAQGWLVPGQQIPGSTVPVTVLSHSQLGL